LAIILSKANNWIECQHFRLVHSLLFLFVLRTITFHTAQSEPGWDYSTAGGLQLVLETEKAGKGLARVQHKHMKGKVPWAPHLPPDSRQPLTARREVPLRHCERLRQR